VLLAVLALVLVDGVLDELLVLGIVGALLDDYLLHLGVEAHGLHLFQVATVREENLRLSGHVAQVGGGRLARVGVDELVRAQVLVPIDVLFEVSVRIEDAIAIPEELHEGAEHVAGELWDFTAELPVFVLGQELRALLVDARADLHREDGLSLLENLGVDPGREPQDARRDDGNVHVGAIAERLVLFLQIAEVESQALLALTHPALTSVPVLVEVVDDLLWQRLLDIVLVLWVDLGLLQEERNEVDGVIWKVKRWVDWILRLRWFRGLVVWCDFTKFFGWVLWWKVFSWVHGL
jgi:hypothetical protein